MSTFLTVSPATPSALVWVNKKGTTLQAHSEVAQAFAPKASRVSHAHTATLQALTNGQYRPFLKDCAEALSKADTKALQRLGFDTMPSNKAGMIQFMRAIVALWASAKGKRAALAAVAGDWLKAQAPATPDTLAPFPPLPETVADTADTLAPADSPLPEIDPALL